MFCESLVKIKEYCRNMPMLALLGAITFKPENLSTICRRVWTFRLNLIEIKSKAELN